MRIQHLHLILAIAQTGSLRASAQRLNVTQPALTKALQQLEAEFGAPLVTRTSKGVRLAPAGELLAARAAIIVREIRRAQEDVAWLTRDAEALVTVGVSPVAAILVVPGAIARFSARWPAVRVRILDALYPEALGRLRAGEIDVLVGPLPPEGAGHDLRTQPLFDSDTPVVARRGHPLAEARRLDELRAADWVLSGPRGGPGDPVRLPWAGEDGTAPRVRLECDSFSTLLSLMPSLDVLGLMPRGFLERFGLHAGLVALPIEDALPRTTLHAVWRADAPLTNAARRMLDAIALEAAENAASHL